MAASDAQRGNGVDQRLDVLGSITLPAAFDSDFTDETKYPHDNEDIVGEVLASGADGQFSGSQFISATGGFTANSVGQVIYITSSTFPSNEGPHKITAYSSATTVVVATGGLTADTGMDWEHCEAYALEHDVNYERADRHRIKGTTGYKDPVPTYTDPSNTGTPKPANLSNIAGNTLDAHLEVRNTKECIKLRTEISDVDGLASASSDTFSTTNYHFTADDVESFVTVVDGTSTGASGTYRISAVTDGKTVTLNGLNPTGSGTASWTMLSDVKSVTKARQHADNTDNRGIPIADAGALDQANYDATYVDVLNKDQNAGVYDAAGNQIYGRTFGDEKFPDEVVPTDGARFAVQLLTGVNSGAATDSSWGPEEAGRTGTAATVAGGDKVIGGLANISTQDVGRFISVYDAGTDGTQGYYQIDSVDIDNDTVTVDRGSNFSADANTGSIKWKITDSEYPIDVTIIYPDVMLQSEFGKADRRVTLVSGVQSDAGLNDKIHDLQEFVGTETGQTTPDLTNTGNYFYWSNIDNPADTSLEELLNIINQQGGDFDFDAVAIDHPLSGCSGETVTALLLKLGNAIAATSIVRTIERLTAAVAKNTAHTLPGGLTYTLDVTDNGRNLWVGWRRARMLPGPNTDDRNDYEETSTTSITPYELIKANDAIDYYVLQ